MRTTNEPTGRVCFWCGQPEWQDDEPFGVAQAHDGTFVVSCCR